MTLSKCDESLHLADRQNAVRDMWQQRKIAGRRNAASKRVAVRDMTSNQNRLLLTYPIGSRDEASLIAANANQAPSRSRSVQRVEDGVPQAASPPNAC
jgi:hypothetical protein